MAEVSTQLIFVSTFTNPEEIRKAQEFRKKHPKTTHKEVYLAGIDAILDKE
jgi:hypothetical protein